tara:strand:- start:1264 stop:1443 length:180 start_codon:yes stop_codon:yes gene_type:complete
MKSFRDEELDAEYRLDKAVEYELRMTDFITVENHDCHPDSIECCDECLELNGYDVMEEE